eukprot:gene6917-7644_t
MGSNAYYSGKGLRSRQHATWSWTSLWVASETLRISSTPLSSLPRGGSEAFMVSTVVKSSNMIHLAYSMINDKYLLSFKDHLLIVGFDEKGYSL